MRVFTWFIQQRAERHARILRDKQAASLMAKRKAAKKPKRPPGRKPVQWQWSVHAVSARTKSEARSLLKRELKLKRMPPGAIITRSAA